MIDNNLAGSLLPVPINAGFRMQDYWVWCGSIIQGEDGKFHMFASRWPKDYTMHPGWIFKSEIVRAVSLKPEGPYLFEEVVLPARGAEYWDGRATHNPVICKYGNEYVLFYVGITYPFSCITPGNTTTEDDKYLIAQSSKRIGIAVSESIYGPWERKDTPLLDVRPGMFDSFLTSNPAPCFNDDGSVLIIYKARKYVGVGMGKMELGAAFAKHYRGPYNIRSSKPIFDGEETQASECGAVEDPFVWRVGDGYCMIAKDMTGNICGELYGGIYADSADGFHWSIRRGERSYSRNVLMEDGIVQTMGSFERPFLLFRDGTPTHLCAAVADGPGCFTYAKNTWNMVIPIKENNEKRGE